jgi:hypothetical protein
MNDKLRELYGMKYEIDNWVDCLMGDTWGWDIWYNLMTELLQYKHGHSPDENTDPKDIVRCGYEGDYYDWVMSEWPDTITWDAEELRDLIGRIEAAMISAVREIADPMSDYLSHEIERLEGEEE